jgi:predicted DNA-binding ribbon-helix-helix protein
MRKRSVTIAGHRTSLSLEEPFWEALRAFAEADGRSVAELVSEIDKARDRDEAANAGGAAVNLSSAVRVYVLRRVAAKA